MDGKILVTVADTGIGMTHTEMERIFGDNDQIDRLPIAGLPAIWEVAGGLVRIQDQGVRNRVYQTSLVFFQRPCELKSCASIASSRRQISRP